MHYLSEYQTFQSKQQLNEAIAGHLAAHRYDLNETVRNVLTVISRYAVKFPGVAHLKAATLADLIGKSEKTARRCINKLEALGIIRKVATTRKVNGGKGANILVVQPAVVDQSTMSSRQVGAEPTESSVQLPEIKSEPYHSINQLKDTKETAGALKRSIPAPLYNALAPYFNDADMYRAVGVLYRAKASVDRSITVEDHASEFIDGLQSVIFAYKRGRVRSLFGCLYAAWREVAVVIKRREVFADMYDWLAS